ncbi:uroporphyrin-III C-methyltransferase / precorrin-2 dehydrogenase / sirohydrochlorin ferrochelatase [Chryseobacterium carnipullorum]|uniref:uroporphyrinogen-III C-methyltransferase n=1 Tax=Chryseobacterium carnipullorum TaxID=1124835 RepID=UPI000920D0E4|nr:uroporphyrinogen-III C-methyltransferase [Chryseobacterium carnipullorum]SHL29814.1 uroporphyrin-III C-methyltransferase / precorrin-2 dehydrogenase / sirohydrochlorin ferrochelatase [Chryseobacterium carnipullorum]
MKEFNCTPKVYLVGAGPGDPDLITIKAVKAIAAADIILCDRLVSPEILERYANKNTDIIYVGKECSKNASTPQSRINALIVEYASQGKTVVRLKGGDISFFSNVLDELKALKEHHLTFEIIPGITAASGAAAYAGIPLTARGYATSVRFLTYYKTEILSDAYWKELGTSEDTLVFYMSKGNLNGLVDKFLALGTSEDKKIAVIEQATTPYQKIYTSSFEDFHENLGKKDFVSPSLVVIGKVVTLHDEFSWLETPIQEGIYFKSVTNGSLVSNPQNILEYAV